MEFLSLAGEIESVVGLTVPKAKALAQALEAETIPYCQLVECRRGIAGGEIIVFDVEVEVPQAKVHPISPLERLAVTFNTADNIAPKVEALRSSFPRVPHLNLHIQEFPRNLCIYAEPYEDVKRTWTPARFISRVRQWLALTAKGELHQADQPLEPLLLDYGGHIVIPGSLLDQDNKIERLDIGRAPFSTPDKLFLIAREDTSDAKDLFPISVHRCPLHNHGLIYQAPATLAHLADLVAPTGLDLIYELRIRLKEWQGAGSFQHDTNLVLLMLFPRRRSSDGPQDRVDYWTFLVDAKIPSIGEDIGIWEVRQKQLGILLNADDSKRGSKTGIAILNTSLALTRSKAALLNDQSHNQQVQCVAIGQGALGSQVIMNLARSGFGSWMLIDKDVLMPHNLARHSLFQAFLGSPKSEGVARFANLVLSDGEPFKHASLDFLKISQAEQPLLDSVKDAHLIIDMSASVAVARRLAADKTTGARRASLFLSPSGKDLVFLVEDAERTITLDAIEMQYYRALLNDERLSGHLQRKDPRQRYGQSCRDLTLILPHAFVALHAAIGAAAIEDLPNHRSSAITLWRCDPKRNVHRTDIPPLPVTRRIIGDWSVVTDEGLLTKLHALREIRLPNETGGVLLGSIDMEHRIIYIVDSLPSPPDSKEWPSLYIRGSQGLQLSVDEAAERTGGMLEYIGEWHSHPRGISTRPSNDDLSVFSWLASLMNGEGLPAIMMIVGDLGNLSCYVGTMSQQENRWA